MLLRSALLLRSHGMLSAQSLSELGTITCHHSSPVAGSFQALCSTPSLTLSASNIVHMPFVAVELPVTSSQGGLCPASTHCHTGCMSMSCSCCVCYSAASTVCVPRQTDPAPSCMGHVSSIRSSLSRASLRSQYWHPPSVQGRRDKASVLAWPAPARCTSVKT